mgnify:CR=1 FL=1
MARILVVDDDDLMQELILFGLEAEGHAVTVVSDGQQALTHLDQEPVDLMVVDLYMPVMDGIRFLTEVRDRLADPPAAVVLSGSTEAGLEQQVRDLGAYDLLRKPIGAAALKAKVAEALSGPSGP